MSLTITGKIIQALPPESVGNSGKQKQVFIVEIPGQFPKKVAVEVWDDKFALSLHESCILHINIESREWNSKWYTSVVAWKKDGGVAATHSATQHAVANNNPAQVQRGAHQQSNQSDDDLPF